ncbi:O-antigen ligase family protein [soil metagenome]
MAVTSTSDGRSSRAIARLAVVAAVLIAIAVGWSTVQLGPLPTFAALACLVAVYLSLQSIWTPIAGLLAVTTLAPFLVLPVSAAGARPTLFELAALGAIGAYVVVLLIDRRQMLVIRLEVVIWAVLGAYLVFAFVLGTRFGGGADLARLFTRFGLAYILFWLILQLVRERRQALRLVEWIVAGVSAAAAIGLLLYAGGPSLTHRALIRLVPYGYPDNRVVRFIEDNPENAMRAIGTGVDPNAFGGLLMVGFVLAVGMLFSRDRRLPAPVLVAAAGLITAAILLTFSRGAWVGAAVGAGVIVWFRARALVPFGVAGGLALLILDAGATFVSRLEAGLRGEDAATIQRFEEYRNALSIIRAHPWFGIGFGDAPSPEFGVGVSSIYLLIAEQTGLVGLALFGLFSIVAIWRAWVRFQETDDDLLLAVGATFAACLTVGLVDHYFFNIRFAHMVGLFWIVAGMIVALSDGSVLLMKQEGDRT